MSFFAAPCECWWHRLRRRFSRRRPLGDGWTDVGYITEDAAGFVELDEGLECEVHVVSTSWDPASGNDLQIMGVRTVMPQSPEATLRKLSELELIFEGEIKADAMWLHYRRPKPEPKEGE